MQSATNYSTSTRIALSSVRKLTTTMLTRGLPRDIMRARPYDLQTHTGTIVSEVDGLRTKRIKKQQQIEHYLDLCARPFQSPYVAVFSARPNDLKAKLAAARLMECGIKQQIKGESKAARGKHFPLWHTINGSFADRLRDGAEERPSMLILSNITVDSTNVKIEKLRDLIEQFNHIPRIIVLTGTDPVTFANSRLYSALNHCLYLSTAKKVEL